MKKIKKECMKNMIAGPSLIDSSTQGMLKPHKQSCSSTYQKESLSLYGQKLSHKNSLVGPNYYSDSEDAKHSEIKAKDELNREAKNWRQQFDRQSSHDLL